MTEPLTIAAVSNELRRLGVVLDVAPGEYRIAARHFSPAAFVTADLAEALAYGRELGKATAAELPPLGPCGKGQSRRGLMYRHNRAIAKKRAKEGRK